MSVGAATLDDLAAAGSIGFTGGSGLTEGPRCGVSASVGALPAAISASLSAGGSADSDRGVEVTVPAGAPSSGIRPNSRSAASATSRLSSAVRRSSAFWAASDVLGSLAAIRSRSVNAAAMRSRGASLFSCSWSEAGRIRIVGARMLWAITQSPTWLKADFVGRLGRRQLRGPGPRGSRTAR